MTYPLTGKLSVVAQAIQDKLQSDAAKFLGLHSVFYGDQDLIPGTPTVCVEPDQKDQDYKPTGFFRQNISVFLLVYVNKVTSPQANRKEADILAEEIEDFIHTDRTLLDANNSNLPRVIEIHVSRIESGYATKKGEIYRTSRITLSGTSQSLMSS